VRLLIGDVRGKGLDGVQHAARVIRAFRQSAARQDRGLGDVAASMDGYLRPFFLDEDFVTALLVEIPGDGALRFVDCGHPPPLLFSGGVARSVDLPGSPPLGLASSFTTVSMPWAPQDRLLLYTDGLVEARDEHGRFFPGERIAECLALPDPDAALDALVAAVAAHVPHGRNDDLALVLVDNAPTEVRLDQAERTTHVVDLRQSTPAGPS
jgi:serine phosphatase RsbU (regulator of sigma subunit)